MTLLSSACVLVVCCVRQVAAEPRARRALGDARRARSAPLR